MITPAVGVVTNTPVRTTRYILAALFDDGVEHETTSGARLKINVIDSRKHHSQRTPVILSRKNGELYGDRIGCADTRIDTHSQPPRTRRRLSPWTGKPLELVKCSSSSSVSSSSEHPKSFAAIGSKSEDIAVSELLPW